MKSRIIPQSKSLKTKKKIKMFAFKMLLPSLSGQLNESVHTLVKGQIVIENFNWTEPVRLDMDPDNQLSFYNIIEYIFDPTRLLRIFGNRDLIHGEIQIVHLTEPLKKKILQKFIDIGIFPKSSSIKEGYFSFNNFKTNEIEKTIYQQQFCLTLKVLIFEPKSLNKPTYTPISPNNTNETLVIKVEPDSI